MILVTGGTGLVGSYLILELIKSGKKVRALKRPNSNLTFIKKVFEIFSDDPINLFNAIEWIDGDILDIESLDPAMKGIDHVYHSAGYISFQKKDFQRLQEINSRGTENLVNTALVNNVEKLCYFSSIAALSRPQDHSQMIDENISWRTSKLNTGYAISKYSGEREVWRGSAEGLKVIIVNPSIILGFSNPEKGSSRIFKSVWEGLKIYPSGINGFVDVIDVVRSSMVLMESNEENRRYILNAVNISYYDLFHKIAAGFGKSGPNFRTAAWMLNAAWMYEALKTFLTGNKPLITRETARTSSNSFLYSNKRITEEVGYKFKDFDQTIHELCVLYSGILSR